MKLTRATHLVLAAAACLVFGAGSSSADKKPLPESNLALLDHAITATAKTLVARAPIDAGAKIAFEKQPEGTVKPICERAMLGALTDHKIEVMQVAIPQPSTAPTVESRPGWGGR